MDSFKNFCECSAPTGNRREPLLHRAGRGRTGRRRHGARRELGRGARVHADLGPRHLADERVHRLAYYAEIPSVFIDVQRVGPSTGMPTRTQQCDLMLCAYASHGDTRHPMLFPSNPKECFEMAVQAFDLADRLQTPVFVLSDLDIGMNDWMVPELSWDDDYRPDRGKVLAPGRPEGDGPVRALPGRRRRRHPLPHPARRGCQGRLLSRGSGHNRYGGYTEDSVEYQDVMDRLLVKWETAKALVPPAVLCPAAAQDPARHHRLRQFGRRRGRGARPPGRAGYPCRLPAPARLSVRPRGRSSFCATTTPCSWSSRTATRR
jgi:hypothetical protein